MKVIGCLILLPIIIILVLIAMLVGTVFSIFGRKNVFQFYTNWNNAKKDFSTKNKSSQQQTNQQQSKKIFTQNDGEYVDFEEIK